MRIVYCINNTWYAGGMTRVLSNKVNYFASKGYDVTIITTDQIGKESNYLIHPAVKHIDLNINYLYDDKKSFVKRLLALPISYIDHYNRLNKRLSAIEADVVIGMFTKDVYLLPFLKDKSAKILEIHSTRYTWLRNRLNRGLIGKFQNWLDSFIVKKYDRFVVLTNEDLKNWSELSNVQVIANANTFITDKVSYLENKVAIAVGRYDQGKNFSQMIDVWAKVCVKHPDWKLKIIGDGSLRDVLEAKVEDCGFSNNIELSFPTNKIMEAYLDSSLLLMTSLYEGLPMVLLEGQSCGLPLISYSCPCGPRDIITHGENGYLVEVGDVEGMAKYIIQLIENPELRSKMSRNAKLNSMKFSEEKIMEQWINLFEDLSLKGRK